MRTSEHGAVSATRIEAIEAGEHALRDGGTAADAAVTACLVLGVVEPYMTGLGGTGELVHLDVDGTCTVVDAAARAPRAAHATLFGEAVGPPACYGWPAVVGRRNEVGGSAVTAPPLLAGLVATHRRFGRLPWARLVEPAIEIADGGWDLDFFSEAAVFDALDDLRAFSDGLLELTYPVGTRPFGLDGVRRRLRNPALAGTLRRVARNGADTLRRGPVADAIVAASRRDGGCLAHEDLQAVEAVVHEEVAPLVTYRGWSVYGSLAPSGAVTTAQILGILEQTPTTGEPGDPAWYGDFASACKVAFDDRFELLSGDDEPESVASFLSERALREAATRASMQPPRTAPTVPASTPLTATTHLSAADRAGRVVSFTSTLLSLFGSRAAAAEHGFYLNNGMMWFDPRPGRRASIHSGGRALSAVSPLVLVDPAGTTRIALGALGGRRIVSAVAQVAAFRIDHGMPLAQAVDIPRVHVEPTASHIDERLPSETRDALRARGFDATSLVYGPMTLAFARPNGVEWSPAGIMAGIDRRSRDTWRYGR
jgi:gamma-glutamyltranspeptidase/glutathione hydrolase